MRQQIRNDHLSFIGGELNERAINFRRTMFLWEI